MKTIWMNSRSGQSPTLQITIQSEAECSWRDDLRVVRWWMAVGLACLVFPAAGVGAQEAAPSAAAPAPPVEVILPPPSELLEQPYLFEVVRHLFRWYMDESDVEKVAGIKEFPFWVRRLDVKLDAGDRSQVAEIILPLVGISAQVKKADYAIEELGVAVKSPSFRIVNVARREVPSAPPADSVPVAANYEEMKAYLFRTRAQAEFPDEALFERLRVALREHFGLDPAQREAGEHVVHVAPLSPVANELWVFVENKKLLVQFSSDLDLENPALWEHQSMVVRTYDVLNQTVVSLHEAPGSNAFLTRDQVGRALYNCVILGRRLAVVNPAPAADAPAAAANRP